MPARSPSGTMIAGPAQLRRAAIYTPAPDARTEPSMKIPAVKTFVVGMTGHNVVLVKVETDEGLYGVVEASLAGREQGVVGVLRHFRELLVGRDPARTEDIWQNLYRNTFWRGGPVPLSAISGVDIP